MCDAEKILALFKEKLQRQIDRLCEREDACMSLDELSILQEKQDSYAHCKELLLMAENEILNGSGTGASR